jgi:hypothetical protein
MSARGVNSRIRVSGAMNGRGAGCASISERVADAMLNASLR